MFRDRPLTWLFVIATIAVDLVLVVSQGDTNAHNYFLSGCVFGQVAALAVWAVRGSMHRLLRFSWLALGAWLWACAIYSEVEVLTLLFFYASVILVFGLLIEVIRSLSKCDLSDAEWRTKWQVSLIELFGWTIIVAIVSFGCRDVDVRKIFAGRGPEFVWDLLSMFAIPYLLILFVSRDLRDLGAIKATILVGATMASDWRIGNFVIATQAAYLFIWMTVLTLDNIFVEAAESRGTSTDRILATYAPKLFNPQD